MLSRLLWPPWEEPVFCTLRSRKQCEVHWWVGGRVGWVVGSPFLTVCGGWAGVLAGWQAQAVRGPLVGALAAALTGKFSPT